MTGTYDFRTRRWIRPIMVNGKVQRTVTDDLPLLILEDFIAHVVRRACSEPIRSRLKNCIHPWRSQMENAYGEVICGICDEFLFQCESCNDHKVRT